MPDAGLGLNGGLDGLLKMVYRSYHLLKKGWRQAKERRGSVKRSAPIRSACPFNSSAHSASSGSSGENAKTLILSRSIDLLSAFPRALPLLSISSAASKMAAQPAKKAIL